MKARHKVIAVRLRPDEFNEITEIHQRYAKDVPLSVFSRQILVCTRMHPYNYINANLLDRPLASENTGPLRNNMEHRYHEKCKFMALFMLLLEGNNIVTDAISANEELYNKILNHFRGYVLSPNNQRDYQDKVSVSAKGPKRSKGITIRVCAEEKNSIRQLYSSSSHAHILPFAEWVRQTLLGKIKQTKFSDYYEKMYEKYKERFFDEPILPGFQTYLHYEAQVLAGLAIVLNDQFNVDAFIQENSERYQYLTETTWGYCFDLETQMKSPLDSFHFEKFDRVIHAKYYRQKEQYLNKNRRNRKTY